jgi:putative SOS response-associated peptidase YedK
MSQIAQPIGGPFFEDLQVGQMVDSAPALTLTEPMNYRGYPLVEPHYNIAPTSVLPILTLEDGQQHISPMTWGITLGPKRSFVINLRAEGVPLRDGFRERRCGVVTDGFYEWAGKANARQPYWFHRPDNALIVMAGLWRWQESPDGFQQTFAIITTRANGLMAPIHDRMPVVIDPARLDTWMDVSAGDLASTKSLLAPAPEDWLVAGRVSQLVNNVRNDGPELLTVTNV